MSGSLHLGACAFIHIHKLDLRLWDPNVFIYIYIYIYIPNFLKKYEMVGFKISIVLGDSIQVTILELSETLM